MLGSVRTRRIHARVEMNGERGTLVMEQKRPSKIRTAITIGDDISVRGYDGVIAWQVDPDGSGARLTPDATGNVARESDFDGALAHYRDEGSRAEYAGRLKFQGRDVFKLKLRRKDGNMSYYYLDPETGLETALEFGRDIGGREVRFLSVFRNYRTVGGLKFAFLIDSRGEESDERMTLEIESVELNPEIDDSRFSLSGNRRGGEIARAR